MPSSSLKLVVAVCAALALSLAACDRTTAPIDARTVASVSVSSTLDTIAPDDTLPLTVALADSAGHAVNGVRIVWSTSDASVATVDSVGRVHGVSPGVVEISAIASGARGSVPLVVRLRPARLIITPDTLGLDDVAVLRYSIVDAQGRVVPYPSAISNSDTNIVAMRSAPLESRTAVVIAAKTGTVTFKAVVEGHTVTAPLSVGAAHVIGVAPMQTSVIAPLGAPRPVIALPYVLGGAVTSAAVHWTTTDPSIATIDDAGVITPQSIGKTTVHAVSDGQSANVNVRVFAYPEKPKFVSVSAGAATACGLSDSGLVYCWGSQTGTDSIEANGISTVPVPIKSTARFSSFVTGAADDMCAVATDGTVYCWNGTAAPVAIATSVRFTSMSRVSNHSCALTSAGTAYCWGTDNSAGQQGTGDLVRSLTPTPVVGGLTFSSIAVTAAASCGITTSNALYCWGLASYPFPLVTSPASRGSGIVWRSISVGYSGQFCALSTASRVYCWQDTDEPKLLTATHSFVQVSPGAQHTCFLDDSGVAYCSGRGDYGALGIGTFPQFSVADPQAVAASVRFKSIAAGNDFTCGATVDGVLYCWGRNTTGQIGGSSLTINMGNLGVVSPDGPQCNYFVCTIGGVYGVPQKVLGQP